MTSLKYTVVYSLIIHENIEKSYNLIKIILDTINQNDRLVITLNQTLEINSIKNLINDNKLIILKNKSVKGFGSNHNFVFKNIWAKYYCIINPDIIIDLENSKKIHKKILLCKGINTINLIDNNSGSKNIRNFDPFYKILIKLLFYNKVNQSLNYSRFYWFSGALLFFDRATIVNLKFFDERYFMYLEDIDLSLKAYLSNIELTYHKDIIAIHNAQRASRKKLFYFYLHFISYLKFYLKWNLKLLKAI